MNPINADAVLIAPDRCTPYLQRAVDTSLRDMAPGAVLEVPCPNLGTRVELAEWCLHGGRRVLNPFEHWGNPRVLIENTSSAA